MRLYLRRLLSLAAEHLKVIQSLSFTEERSLEMNEMTCLLIRAKKSFKSKAIQKYLLWAKRLQLSANSRGLILRRSRRLMLSLPSASLGSNRRTIGVNYCFITLFSCSRDSQYCHIRQIGRFSFLTRNNYFIQWSQRIARRNIRIIEKLLSFFLSFVSDTTCAWQMSMKAG